MENTPKDPRHALHAFDPSRDDAAPSPECAEAAEAALADPELRRWWDREQAFDHAFAAKLRSQPVPADLRQRILTAAADEHAASAPTAAAAAPAVVPSPSRAWWHWSAFGGAAAAVVMLALFYTFVFNPTPATAASPRVEQLMTELGTVLEERSATMHRDDSFVRLVHHLESAGAPVPKYIPAGLPQEGGFACAHLVVDGIPVGMMCFRVEEGIFHMFTIDRAHLPEQSDLPREVVRQVGSHHCATWTRGDQLYILATKEPAESVRTVL